MHSEASSHFCVRLFRQVQAQPDSPAVVVDGKVQLTFRQLWIQSGVFANTIQDYDLESENLAAICLPKSAEFIAAVVGCWRAGSAWLPIDPFMPLARIQYILDDSKCDFIIARRDFKAFQKTALPVLDIDAFSKEELRRHQTAPLHKVSEQCQAPLAYVIYTSGTTGKPKGVEVTHRGLVPMLDQQIKALKLTPESRSLFLLSTSFDASISDIGTALLSGASLWIENQLFEKGRLKANSETIERVIRKNKITYVDIPPSLLSRMSAKACPPTLKSVLIGGEVCPDDVVRDWASKVRLLNVYGPTEATICTSFTLCDPKKWNRPLIGRPIDGVEYVLDRYPEGELLIGGDHLARGYRNRQELTNSKFIMVDEKRFYRTGDLILKDKDGEFVFRGRIDRQMKIRGHRIEPEEIENTLIMHPNVLRAIVIGVNQNSIEAFVSLNSHVDSIGQRQIERNFRETLSSSLPSYLLPSRFHFLREFPQYPSGKINIDELHKLASNQLRSTIEPNKKSKSKRQRTLFNSFEQVLGHSSFDLDDSFFDVGGDSLKALELITLVQREGLDLNPQDLFELQTIRKLSAVQHRTSTLEMPAEVLRNDIDAILSNDKSIEVNYRSQSKSITNLFLTGATGFLGTRLLKQLLKKQPVQIACLVRGKSQIDAEQRFEKRLESNGVKISLSERARITIVPGDIRRERFGLPAQYYDRLANSVQQVIHCAAEVNLVANYDDLRDANVIGTYNVAKFVRDQSPKLFEYVSTLSVFVGTDRNKGIMLESDNLQETQFIYGGYAQSKWAAEILLRRIPFQIQPRIYRLGLLTADMEKEVAPAFDLLTLAMRGVAQLGISPICQEDHRVDITPVNFAANILSQLILRNTVDNTFHIAHPTGLSSISLFENARIVSKLKAVEPAEFEKRSEEHLGDGLCAATCLALGRMLNRSMEFPDPFNLFQASENKFDMSATNRALNNNDDCTAPILDAKFIQKLIQICQATDTTT